MAPCLRVLSNVLVDVQLIAPQYRSGFLPAFSAVLPLGYVYFKLVNEEFDWRSASFFIFLHIFLFTLEELDTS